jgi:hypothetical protein
MDWLLISEKSSGIRCDSAMLHILVESEGQYDSSQNQIAGRIRHLALLSAIACFVGYSGANNL